MSRTFLIAPCLGLAAVCGGRARADLVMNGDFETESPAGCQTSANPSSCSVPPPNWTATGDGIAIDTTFPNTGTYDVAFTALSSDPSPGTLSQTLATMAGQSYTLNFALLDEGGYSGDTFTVTLGNFSTAITGDNAPFPGNLPSGYNSESFTVPGADILGNDTLSFQGLLGPLSNSSAWNLDDVSVNGVAVVPAPVIGSGLPTFLVVGGILFGVCCLQRSRKRRSLGEPI